MKNKIKKHESRGFIQKLLLPGQLPEKDVCRSFQGDQNQMKTKCRLFSSNTVHFI